MNHLLYGAKNKPVYLKHKYHKINLMPTSSSKTVHITNLLIWKIITSCLKKFLSHVVDPARYLFLGHACYAVDYDVAMILRCLL